LRVLARGWVRVMDAEPSAQRYFEVIDNPIEIRDARERRVRGAAAHECALRERHVHLRPRARARAGRLRGARGRGRGDRRAHRRGQDHARRPCCCVFYDPTAGRITFDGVDLRDARRASLLDQMAVVSQEPFLFDGSIRENIRYGRLDATDEEILAAARAAHVDEFAEGLPEGYETEVGAGGARLSGGQRQRVTIARAILRDPAVLVLDEATSSLDSKSERLVQDAIDKLIPGRTAFVIAHRLSTVRAAHKIIVLEHGRVSQIGNHDELMAQSGLYRELVQIQTGTRPGETVHAQLIAAYSASTRSTSRCGLPLLFGARARRATHRALRSGSSSSACHAAASASGARRRACRCGRRRRARAVHRGARSPREFRTRWPRAARGSRRRIPAPGT
jgi:ABC-type multidrug transport system ATPase subunit